SHHLLHDRVRGIASSHADVVEQHLAQLLLKLRRLVFRHQEILNLSEIERLEDTLHDLAPVERLQEHRSPASNLNQPEQALTLLEPLCPALQIRRGRDQVVVGKLTISSMQRMPFVTPARTHHPSPALAGTDLALQVKEVLADFFQPHRDDGNLELDQSITALRR